MPEVKFCSASRPDLSWTLTCSLMSLRSEARPARSLPLLCAVGGQEVPLRRAGGERVRRQDLDARLEQVVPGLDVLRVALAHDERRRPTSRRGPWSACRPSPRDEAGLRRGGRCRARARRRRRRRAGRPRPRGSGRRRRRRTARSVDALAGVGLLEAGDDLVVDDLRRRVGDERRASPSPCPPRRARRAAAGVLVGRAAAAGRHESGEDGDDSEQGTGSQGDLRS